jgi:TonB family protein
MRFKIPALFIFCLFCFTCVSAQKRNVYFLKNSGDEVSSRDSADYIRIISEPDSGANNFNLVEYYKNGKPKLIGKTSTINRILLEESCIKFYPNGKKQQVGSYINGNPDGLVFEYYPNGTLYTITRFTPRNTIPESLSSTIEQCNDSTGNVLAKDGNGYYINYTNDFKIINEEGSIKAGAKDGVWKGITGPADNKYTYSETYDKGKFLSGQAKIDGKTVNYTSQSTQPQFESGIDRFLQFVAGRIRYPSIAKTNNIEGRVIVSFFVDVDGTLTDFTVKRSPGSGLDDEAIRVLKLSRKWTPGTLHGCPVKTAYTIPIDFSLGNR